MWRAARRIKIVAGLPIVCLDLRATLLFDMFGLAQAEFVVIEEASSYIAIIPYDLFWVIQNPWARNHTTKKAISEFKQPAL